MAFTKEDVANKIRFTGATSYLGGGLTQGFDYGGESHSVNIAPGQNANQAVADYLNKLETGGQKNTGFTPGAPIDPRTVPKEISGYDYAAGGGIYGQPKSYAPQSVITSDILAPQQNLASQIQRPTYTPTPTISSLGGGYALTPEELRGGSEGIKSYQERVKGLYSQEGQDTGYDLTQPEQQVQTLGERLQTLNEQLVGKSAYKTQQEQAFGIAEKAKAVNDLTAQLRNLQAEALAIPVQLEEAAAGRGITTEIVGRQQEKLLRTNAIKALSVNALLQAAQGNLALANDMVDRAVAAQFDPIEDEINAKLANLKIIQSSPEYTNAEKKRADKRELALQTQKDQLEETKLDKKRIYDISILAAQNGADALTLQRIQNAKTPQEAIISAGSSIQEQDTQIVEAGNRKLLINSRTGAVIRDLGVADIEKAGKIAGGTSYTLKNLGGQGTNMEFVPSSDLTAAQKQKVNTVVAGSDLINQAEQLYNEAIGSEYSGFGSGVLARLKGLARSGLKAFGVQVLPGGSQLGLNQKWQAYQNFLDSNRAPIAKGIKGEVGNLAEQEQINALKSFPSGFSSPYEARIAFDSIRSQVQSNIRTLGTLDSSEQDQPAQELQLSPEQLNELRNLGLIE